MRRIEPYFPLCHGIARVEDRRMIRGIIFVIRNGLRALKIEILQLQAIHSIRSRCFVEYGV